MCILITCRYTYEKKKKKTPPGIIINPKEKKKRTEPTLNYSVICLSTDLSVHSGVCRSVLQLLNYYYYRNTMSYIGFYMRFTRDEGYFVDQNRYGYTYHYCDQHFCYNHNTFRVVRTHLHEVRFPSDAAFEFQNLTHTVLCTFFCTILYNQNKILYTPTNAINPPFNMRVQRKRFKKRVHYFFDCTNLYKKKVHNTLKVKF